MWFNMRTPFFSPLGHHWWQFPSTVWIKQKLIYAKKEKHLLYDYEIATFWGQIMG